MANASPPGKRLTHIDESGKAHMVDVGWKPDTDRVAVARGQRLGWSKYRARHSHFYLTVTGPLDVRLVSAASALPMSPTR